MSSKVGRLTKDVLDGSMMNAYEAGFAKALECLMPDLDDTRMDLDQLKEKCWEEWGQFGVTGYDPRDNKDAKVSPSRGRGRPPATPSPKNPPDSPELSEMPFNVECCSGRKWMSKGDARGLGRQCVKDRVEGEDLCVDCLSRRDDMSKDFWGYYDKPLGDESEHTKDGARGNRHAWKDLKDQRAAEKDSEKEEDVKKKLEKMKEKKKEQEQKKKEKKEKKKKEKEEKEEEKKKEKEEKKKEKEEKKEEEKDEETLSLDEDENDYEEEKPDENFVEHIVDGVPLKWNKLTNDLLDPDDDMIMGKMEPNEDGVFIAVINDSDSDSDDEDSDDEDKKDPVINEDDEDSDDEDKKDPVINEDDEDSE